MRTRMMNLFVVTALLGTALTGCKNGGEQPDDDGVALAQPVTIIERISGSSDALKTIGAMHIETKEQYDVLGDADIFPGGTDFDKNDLIIVALGEQPSGGYAVKIESIQKVGGELAVTGKATTPGKDELVSTVLTYPYTAVVIPNTSADTVVPYID